MTTSDRHSSLEQRMPYSFEEGKPVWASRPIGDNTSPLEPFLLLLFFTYLESYSRPSQAIFNALGPKSYFLRYFGAQIHRQLSINSNNNTFFTSERHHIHMPISLLPSSNASASEAPLLLCTTHREKGLAIQIWRMLTYSISNKHLSLPSSQSDSWSV